MAPIMRRRPEGERELVMARLAKAGPPQRAFPDDDLRIVASGEKEDKPPEAA